MLGTPMAHGFDAYRIFISAPGDLDADRQASYDAIAHINEAVAMPAKVLLVAIGLRDSEHIVGHRGIVSDNVRWSSYFIQVFQDDWGPRDLFRKLFLLALECREDALQPMRDVVVFLKDAPHETNAEILAFRTELEDRKDVRVLRYSSVEQLMPQLEEVCRGWAESVISAPDRAAPETSTR
jgi:hypothetical protein